MFLIFCLQKAFVLMEMFACLLGRSFSQIYVELIEKFRSMRKYILELIGNQ
jgi:hypothetical protein